MNGIDQKGYATEVAEEPNTTTPTLHGAPEGITLKGIKLPSSPTDGAQVTIPIEGSQPGYAIYDAQSDTWNYSNSDVSGAATDANTPSSDPEPATIWDYLGLPGLWEGVKQMTVWDWVGVISELAIGLSPLGIFYDIRDVYEAVKSADPKALGLALLAFLPVGDVLKVLKKIHKKGQDAIDSAIDSLNRARNSTSPKLQPDGFGDGFDMPDQRRHNNNTNGNGNGPNLPNLTNADITKALQEYHLSPSERHLREHFYIGEIHGGAKSLNQTFRKGTTLEDVVGEAEELLKDPSKILSRGYSRRGDTEIVLDFGRKINAGSSDIHKVRIWIATDPNTGRNFISSIHPKE